MLASNGNVFATGRLLLQLLRYAACCIRWRRWQVCRRAVGRIWRWNEGLMSLWGDCSSSSNNSSLCCCNSMQARYGPERQGGLLAGLFRRLATTATTTAGLQPLHRLKAQRMVMRVTHGVVNCVHLAGSVVAAHHAHVPAAHACGTERSQCVAIESQLSCKRSHACKLAPSCKPTWPEHAQPVANSVVLLGRVGVCGVGGGVGMGGVHPLESVHVQSQPFGRTLLAMAA